uniref:Methylamine/Aralkylamine dehydrogenase light chain C-terminal domain-containing protein n=1 Tax=Thermomicrobium roseum TaxID=500 RepID=A0A7C1XEU6_THERO
MSHWNAPIGAGREKRSTRRSWVQRLAVVLLAIGATFSDHPPLSAQANCGQWHRCGMCGCLCSCLGGSDTACPPGTSPGGAWWVCCYASGRWWLIRYLDCCGPKNSQPACPSGCSCNQRCGQPPANQNWCPNPESNGAYCTRAQVWSQC